jgi:ADP-ribosyl-[dinitrogen reductase] hydrolase
MLGALIGDIVGAPHETAGTKTKTFPLFSEFSGYTDDSVCTCAVADWLLHGGDPAKVLQRWGRAHPYRRYGGMFQSWLMHDDPKPYGSWGNGAAMRVSPIGFLAGDLPEVFTLAEQVTNVTHNHPEAVRGATAVAASAFLARQGASPKDVIDYLTRNLRYSFVETVREIRRWYKFDVSCEGTVVFALTCAFEARSFEDAVRNAVSLGGDADTLAAIAGGVAQAMFPIPDAIATEARTRLPADMLSLLDTFSQKVESQPLGAAR